MMLPPVSVEKLAKGLVSAALSAHPALKTFALSFETGWYLYQVSDMTLHSTAYENQAPPLNDSLVAMILLFRLCAIHRDNRPTSASLRRVRTNIPHREYRSAASPFVQLRLAGG